MICVKEPVSGMASGAVGSSGVVVSVGVAISEIGSGVAGCGEGGGGVSCNVGSAMCFVITYFSFLFSILYGVLAKMVFILPIIPCGGVMLSCFSAISDTCSLESPSGCDARNRSISLFRGLLIFSVIFLIISSSVGVFSDFTRRYVVPLKRFIPMFDSSSFISIPR